uniref:mitochondrial amidoxime-reducing component 1-like n=1 Tax=Styela clava TaxID=7725 RepID=UPI00193AA782|nr:mitochondrial amidoxime-reducing component 1-like [Styela clava]
MHKESQGKKGKYFLMASISAGYSHLSPPNSQLKSMQISSEIIVYSVVSAGIVIGYLAWHRATKQRKWKEVATVTNLFIYPIKSCLRPSQEHQNQLILEAPEMDPIKFNVPTTGQLAMFKLNKNTVSGIDCGDEVAAWLTKFMRVDSARLIFHAPNLPTRESSLFVKFGHLGVYSKKLNLVFQYGSPFNMISQASIDDLNKKMNNKYNATVRHFRPNILIDGCAPYAEDNWRRMRIGTAEFLFIRHCTRCLVTTVDPKTGIRDPAQTALKTLRSYRLCKPEEGKMCGNSPKLSVEFLAIKKGNVSVGDKVYVKE